MKIEFNVADLKDYDWLLKLFFLTDNLFKQRSLDNYPELVSLLKNSTDEEKVLLDFFKNFEKNHQKDLMSAKKLATNSWKSVENSLIKSLEKIHGVTIPRTIYSLISLSPVCPRFFEENTFYLFYRFDSEKIIDTILHEISHFFFFEVFKSLFPEISSDQYGYPHLVWKLSEMVPGVVLKDPLIQNIFSREEYSVYEVIPEIVVENELLLDHLQKLYVQRKDFSDFVEKAYAYVQKHERIIETYF